MRRSTMRTILNFLFKILTHAEARGLENVPPEGAIILATNHMSRIDVPLLFVMSGRDDLIALVGDSYKANPFFAFIIQASGCIWIDRDRADFTAMRAGLDYIRKGGMLGIAPEGTRSRVGSLLEAKAGVVLLAEKARVPIIPVAIQGTENCMEQLWRLTRPQIIVHYGKPFELAPIDRGNREASLTCNTEEIMCRIAAMLPPRYHGYYAGHPRLQELLREGIRE